MSPRRSLAKIVLAATVAGALVRAAVACVDVTPLYVEPREASTPDAAICLSCISQPNSGRGCADEIAACQTDPRCLTVYDCMVTNACLERVVFDDKIACTLPCLQDAGISTTRDPSVDSLLAIVKCGEKGCASECGLGEGGAGLSL